MVAWSAGLLDAAERRAFEDLAAFAGAVPADDAGAVGIPLFVLAGLAERSLLVADTGPGGTSFRMLATIRAVAEGWLEASGRADLVRARHAQHVLDVVRAKASPSSPRRPVGPGCDRRSGPKPRPWLPQSPRRRVARPTSMWAPGSTGMPPCGTPWPGSTSSAEILRRSSGFRQARERRSWSPRPMTDFPERRPGVLHLTQGGQETQLMHEHGHDLPEFALFPLLDRPKAVADLTTMYTQYLEVAAEHGFGALVGGLDHRASPHWAERLGPDAPGPGGLPVALNRLPSGRHPPVEGQIPELRIAGMVGPRDDAYAPAELLGPAEAEDYHAVQLGTLAEAGVDLVSAMTFSTVAEAVGVARAAHGVGLPLTISFLTTATDGSSVGRPSGRRSRPSTPRPARPDRRSTGSTARTCRSSSPGWPRLRRSGRADCRNSDSLTGTCLLVTLRQSQSLRQSHRMRPRSSPTWGWIESSWPPQQPPVRWRCP